MKNELQQYTSYELLILKKKEFFLFLRFLGLALCLWFLFKIINLGEIVQLITTLPWYVFICIIAIVLMRIWLLAVRWMILSPSDTGLSQYNYIRLILASGSVNLFLPGILGADVVRSILVAREAKTAAGGAFLSVYLDRIIGLLSMLFVAIVVVQFSPLPGHVLYTIVIFSAITVILVILWIGRHSRLHHTLNAQLAQFGYWANWISERLNGPLSILEQYRPSMQRILLALALCLPIHGSWFLIVWLIGEIFGADVSFLTIVIATSLVWVITMLPLTIGGIGVRELSFIYILGLYGVSEEPAIIMALIQTVILLAVGIIGLPILFHLKQER